MTPSKHYRYRVRVPYISSAVKPAQYRRNLRSERRIAMWRTVAVMCTCAALLFLMLAAGFLDWLL